MLFRSLIARLVQDLNARLFERAWSLIAPPDLLANSCLFVMGSEGRGEQLLKTDQDNGLILRDGYAAPADLEAICQRFSQALASFGYPECPGHIMVSNPQWRKSTGDFSQMVQQWLLMPSPDSLMNLAIFLDAHAVCGDAHLLTDVQQSLMRLATDNDAMLARFASAIDAFGNSQGWWNRLLGLDEGLHLKKEGIFPIVHGVRSLALANHLDEKGTVARIDELVPPGKKDIHGDFGAYCYVGFRHSLCHGWASGPTAWLSEYVLGCRPLAPGCTRLLVSPQLGDLTWAEGAFPTPRGPVKR